MGQFAEGLDTNKMSNVETNGELKNQDGQNEDLWITNMKSVQ